VTTINDLAKGVAARVIAIRDDGGEISEKLREFGFSEGDEVEVLAFGPLGGQPLAVRLNRTIVAMRSAEAAAIEVQV
jgi:ferrous iron transport protein A